MTVAIQRPLKGSRISTFYPVKTLPPISALDSAFQLQEYISLLIRLDVHNVQRIVSIPGKEDDGSENGGSKGEDKDGDKDNANGVNVDPACWVYEHLRRVAQDLSHPLITMLQQECTRQTCPEMKAGEWLYLCVAHGNEGAMEQCCAIDYILHTLDSATALLNSPRAFPSRLSVPGTSHRHFTSLCRRLGRIFAHAYFHHREVFEQAEAESSLYARFLALVKRFELVPLEFLVIPPRMEGRAEAVEPPRLMGASLEPRKDADSGRAEGSGSPWSAAQEGGFRGTRGKSPPGPAGQTRNESPRKFGRARTDTMVYSEAFSVAEELAKGDLSEVDIDREIAAERAAAAAGTAELYVPPVPATVSAEPVGQSEEPHEPKEEQQSSSPPPEASSETSAEKEEQDTEPGPSSEAAEEDAPKPAADEPSPAEPEASDTSEAQAPSEEPSSAVVEETTAPAPEPVDEPEHSAEPSIEEADAAAETKTEEPSAPPEESEAAPPSAPAEEPSTTAEPAEEVEAEASPADASAASAASEVPEETPAAPESAGEPEEETKAEESSEQTDAPEDAAVTATKTEEESPESKEPATEEVKEDSSAQEAPAAES
ncbi:Mob1/phocein [Trametes coccinea BRFM310]|uniref:Mob1/phocein n=1 Tax=Trametes coccinea (strain BRFM310) TaxID=1353009 RepID=A0A1Y2J446_TRAC3|nr:Mob1/phocein [Trametes coccinea BRFM310]